MTDLTPAQERELVAWANDPHLAPRPMTLTKLRRLGLAAGDYLTHEGVILARALERAAAPSSYQVARRHGLTASQHYALRLIGQRGDAHTLNASANDVAVVTLRSLHRRDLIVPYREQAARLGWVLRDYTWGDFKLTPDGEKLADALGEWLP